MVGRDQHPQIVPGHAGLRPQRTTPFHGGMPPHVADSLWWSTFNDPAKSKIAGKVAAARFPLWSEPDPAVAWDDIWGWAIPNRSRRSARSSPEVLEAMMLTRKARSSLESDRRPAANTTFWRRSRRADPFMKLLKESCSTPPTRSRRLFFPQWPAAQGFNDTVSKAVTGKREDIAKVLAEAHAGSKGAQ